MASTSMSIMEITCRKPRTKDNEDLSQLDSRGLLQMFFDYCNTVHPDRLVDSFKSRYAKILDVTVNGYMVTASLDYGDFGNSGRTYNVWNHERTHSRTADESATVHTRLSLMVPPGGTSGLFFIERESNRGGGKMLIDEFIHALKGSFPDKVFDTNSVQEPEAWLKAAQMSKVAVHRKNWRGYLTGNPTISSSPFGTLSVEFVPAKGTSFFPAALRDDIMERRLDAAEFLELPNEQEDSDVVQTEEITLQHNGRKVRFEIGAMRTPLARIALTDDRESQLAPKDLINRCYDEAEDFYTRTGFSWNSDWKRTKGINEDDDREQWAHRDVDPPAIGGEIQD